MTKHQKIAEIIAAQIKLISSQDRKQLRKFSGGTLELMLQKEFAKYSVTEIGAIYSNVVPPAMFKLQKKIVASMRRIFECMLKEIAKEYAEKISKKAQKRA